MPWLSRKTIVFAVKERRKNEVEFCGLCFRLNIRRVKESMTEGKRGKEGRLVS